jgi:hypothetical protein
MADETPALPPLEIPWKLASTTQPLAAGEPAETALSLFTFEADDAALNQPAGDERIVFVKHTATVRPAAFPAALNRLAASFLGEGIPCLHLLLDLKVSNSEHTPGTIRPYFHAAAPMSRRMVQTGVVGGDEYEGESDSVAVGKSGMQMREGLRSHSTTKSGSLSAGLSLGPVSLGGSASITSTDVSSSRAVSQVVDTTNRQASEERRELVSHSTNVENIISLLRTKYVGTPHLSFSLSPQPLMQLSVDPSDPNLWFQQLLARRSTGIEGVQEFVAAVVVPRDSAFCISARLRRVCLLDSPPGPFTVEERFNGSLLQLNRMVQYLYRHFPPGTPLEELDIDVLGGLANAGGFKRPVLELWGLRLLPQLVIASVVSPGNTEGSSAAGRANYKHFLEVWLDTLRDEYERDVARSPLERGVLFGENRLLDTCLVPGDAGAPLTVTSSNASVSPLIRVPLPRGVFDIGGTRTLTRGEGSSPRTRAIETTTRWNAIEQRVATLLDSGRTTPEVPLAANDPAVLALLLETWRKLPADDPRNVDLDRAAKLLQLSDAQRKSLQGSGATNLSSLAAVLLGAPQIEAHNVDAAHMRELFRARRFDAPPDLLKGHLSGRDAQSIVKTIGGGLGSTAPAAPGPASRGAAKVRGRR